MLNDAAGVEADLTVSVIESGTNQSHSPQFDGMLALKYFVVLSYNIKI